MVRQFCIAGKNACILATWPPDKTLSEENKRRKELGLPPLAGKNPTKPKELVSVTQDQTKKTDTKSGVFDKIKSALNIGGDELDETSMWDDVQWEGSGSDIYEDDE